MDHQLKTSGFVIVIESHVTRKGKRAEQCCIDADEGGVHSEMKWGKKFKKRCSVPFNQQFHYFWRIKPKDEKSP